MPPRALADGRAQTDRLTLRPIAEHDAEAVWSIHSDARTNLFNPAGPMRERSRADEQAREWASSWATDGQGYWAVELREQPGAVVGFGGIRLVQWRDRRVYNLYYRLAPAVWGRGLAGELVEASVARWRELGDHPLVAYTTADNLPSQRVASRGGLERRPEFDEVRATYTDVVFGLGLR
ncbi:GNAT family N-acetyltransferase [Agreia sp. COWG]|uniref:GNAT family N-acetyltransferase n=1 Tax=Agreia sp. COWG TaxID=2773266 RepID=UPI001925B3A7|nr:GNAT family N-acetyltransferase [Agreia sp. COWG]CAD5990983.1 N-acetyltransferase [Agreia sp. COWG]